MMIVCDAAGAMQPRDDGCRGGEVTGEEARTALISCHAQGSCSDAPLRAGPRAGHSSRAFWRGPVGGVSHVTVPPSSPGARLRGFNFLLPPGGASANLLRWTLRRHGEWGMGLAAQRKASLARNVASPRTAVAGGGGTRATVPPPHLKVPPVEAQRPWGPPPRRFSTGPGAGPGIRGGSGRRGASRPGHRAGALPRGTPHPRRDGARAPVPGTPPGTLRLGRRAPPLGTARPAGMPRPSRGCRGAPRPAPPRRDGRSRRGPPPPRDIAAAAGPRGCPAAPTPPGAPAPRGRRAESSRRSWPRDPGGRGSPAGRSPLSGPAAPETRRILADPDVLSRFQGATCSDSRRASLLIFLSWGKLSERLTP